MVLPIDLNFFQERDDLPRKITLRSHPIELKALKALEAEQIRGIRERFNMSRTVFAKKLRISPRTLERWEQGVSQPNQQACVLILLVVHFKDTIERIAALDEKPVNRVFDS